MSDFEDKLTSDLMEVRLFAMMAAWKVPWQKCWLPISMLERRWPVAEIEMMVIAQAQNYSGLSKVFFPDPGWLQNMVDETKPNFKETAFLSTLINGLADAFSEDMKVASGAKKPAEIKDHALAVPLYREAIGVLSNYVPLELTDREKESFLGQRDLCLEILRKSLSTHMLISGQGGQSEAIYALLTSNPIATFAGTVEKVMQSAAATADYLETDRSVDAIQYAGTETENELNPKHLIYTGNADFLARRNLRAVVDKYRRALELLSIDFINKGGDVLPDRLSAAAREFENTPYSVPQGGDVFYAANHLLVRKEYSLARRYLILYQELNSRSTAQNQGFAKIQSDFILYHSLSIVLTHLNRLDDAVDVLEKCVELGVRSETPQDITGRTLGTAMVSKVLARYALVLQLLGKTADSKLCWQKVLQRQEFLEVISELCAERLEAGDLANANIMLELVAGCAPAKEKTSVLIFYSWILKKTGRKLEAQIVDKEVEGRSDRTESLSMFIIRELVMQRSELDAAEAITKVIEVEFEQASENNSILFYHPLTAIYLSIGQNYQQTDRPDQAEATYKKGLLLLEKIKTLPPITDWDAARQLDYVSAELVTQYALFLEDSMRRSDAALIRERYSYLIS